MLAMLVDDSRSSLSHVMRLLEASGDVDCQAFDDIDLALDAANRTRFDLVIVDHALPKINGVEFIRRLRAMATYAQVPLAMLTGSSSQLVRLKAIEAGATDFLPKDIDGIELSLKLRNLIALSLAVRARDDHAARLVREIELGMRRLQDREEEMIFRLSLTVEYRDNDTGEHTLRVARYSRMIAEELGLSAQECRSIYLAAPLHDIGKVAVPDHVLLKPGRLTAEETAIVRTHAAVGERILADSTSDLMRLAAEIADYHHERWDGEGYPKRIAGTAIPLSARIVAVADVFDAMTSDRPYKAAVSVEVALDCLKAERGHHFDPRCVDAFVAGYKRLQTSAASGPDAADVAVPAPAPRLVLGEPAVSPMEIVPRSTASSRFADPSRIRAVQPHDTDGVPQAKTPPPLQVSITP